MRFSIIAKVLGVLLMLFSLTLVPPTLVSLWYHDKSHLSFLMAFFITLITGLVLWFPTFNIKQELRTRDGFLVTALFWAVLALFGALPFIFSAASSLSITDAVFEALSGLTTTGATVIVGLDYLPQSILYYRQQLQWLGGIGIIVIAVAILPMLGIGGMQLYRAETPGPVKDNKLTPRITETAKALFVIYLTLTVTCALAYWAAGMSLFDAIGHAYATVAIGGFSTHDASIGFFNSEAIYIIAIIFMILSGINFALHFTVWRDRSIKSYWRDPECRFYLTMILLGLSITIGYLYYTNTYNLSSSFLVGSFELVSILTTTGFGVADFTVWPTFLPYLIFMFAFMGGCASSAGGGMKMIRIMLIFKQGIREINRLIHPNAIIPIKVGSKTVSDRVVEAVWGFFAVYVICYVAMMLILLGTGLDVTTAFTAVGACINNLGPGLGDVAANYSSVNTPAKWVLCFAMLLGRLEVFTLLVLFSPMFWRR
ncbi:TrkH family potassium uptake protein [Marinagarivorans cellulosilyticus]|uniref:Trk system potassium uptake protein n=1 Tax=Marinagarivorans cellulosilyticus TaxID=2721545 RepID=A0AAN2BM16_9GAMM|nr:TrkH family potassium uptake protein [Marinagarivorans cellulosilyticus]BCD99679.1 trk system potassium uptake protein [Marinagarivorans cellulosilyticus]